MVFLALGLLIGSSICYLFLDYACASPPQRKAHFLAKKCRMAIMPLFFTLFYRFFIAEDEGGLRMITANADAKPHDLKGFAMLAMLGASLLVGALAARVKFAQYPDSTATTKPLIVAAGGGFFLGILSLMFLSAG